MIPSVHLAEAVDAFAIIRNTLADRIDRQTVDHGLLENLNMATYEVNENPPPQDAVPDFARITGDDPEYDRIARYVELGVLRLEGESQKRYPNVIIHATGGGY